MRYFVLTLHPQYNIASMRLYDEEEEGDDGEDKD